MSTKPRGRKRATPASSKKLDALSNKKGKKSIDINWEYDSDNINSDDEVPQGMEESSEEENETAAEKRVRMANDYLQTLKGDNEEGSSDEEDSETDEDGNVQKLLQEDVLRAQGRLRVNAAAAIGEALESNESVTMKQYKGHRMSPTCVALCESEDIAFTAAKDCSIIRWDVETGKRLAKYPGRQRRKGDTDAEIEALGGHHDEVLSLAVSTDGRYMASGSRDQTVRIWDARTDEMIDILKGHRGAVTGLCFRKNTAFLMSGSEDRSVRVWNVEDMSFVESLYGHQAPINAVDSFYRDRAVSVSADRSLRMWKIPEETQLVFRGQHKASMDCVAMIDEVHFAVGSQDGGLSFWHTSKKRPCSYIPNAHSGKWVSAISALRNSDAIFTGSSDGLVKIWQVDMENRNIHKTPVGQYEVTGFVNGIACGKTGRVVVAAVAQEHRLGRWERIKQARNGIHVARLNLESLNMDNDDISQGEEESGESSGEEE